jgi:hypothetical protein
MRRTFLYTFAALAAAQFIVTGCRKTEPPAPSQSVRVVAAAELPNDPADKAWRNAPEFEAKLLLQDLVEPRLMKASTEMVRVRALSNGSEVAFRLAWKAPAPSDMPGAARFPDACAVQLPAKIEPSVPAPQMGESGRPVEITYWRATWQATVNGRGDSIRDIYPNAAVDHYPFEAASLEKGSPAQLEMAARYAPARALENHMAGPRKTPVQDLIAEGPGTIMPAPRGESRGCGKWTPEGWAVVLIRKLPAGLTPTVPTQVALAVWQGAEEEAGPRKMRTGWVPLTLEAGHE